MIKLHVSVFQCLWEFVFDAPRQEFSFDLYDFYDWNLIDWRGKLCFNICIGVLYSKMKRIDIKNETIYNPREKGISNIFRELVGMIIMYSRV